jgi:hypothetical protein
VHIIAALWHSVRVHNVLWIMVTGKDNAAGTDADGVKHSAVYFILVGLLLVALYFWQGHKLLALL